MHLPSDLLGIASSKPYSLGIYQYSLDLREQHIWISYLCVPNNVKCVECRFCDIQREISNAGVPCGSFAFFASHLGQGASNLFAVFSSHLPVVAPVLKNSIASSSSSDKLRSANRTIAMIGVANFVVGEEVNGGT